MNARETTLEWCRRRAGEEHRLAVEYSDDEAAARARVFEDVARRLQDEHALLSSSLSLVSPLLNGKAREMAEAADRVLTGVRL